MKILPALLASILIAAVLSLAFNQKAQAIHYEITTGETQKLSSGIGWVTTKFVLNGKAVDLNDDILKRTGQLSVALTKQESLESVSLESHLNTAPIQNLKHEVTDGVTKTEYEVVGFFPYYKTINCQGQDSFAVASVPYFSFFSLNDAKYKAEGEPGYVISTTDPCGDIIIEPRGRNQFDFVEGLVMIGSINNERLVSMISGHNSQGRSFDSSGGVGVFASNVMEVRVLVKITTTTAGIFTTSDTRSFLFSAASPTFRAEFPIVNGTLAADIANVEIVNPGNEGKEPGALDFLNEIFGGADCSGEDADNDGAQNCNDNDIDGDGTENKNDIDMDGDGRINPTDPDMDEDGSLNIEDSDMDGDRVSNEKDDDTDGDGIPNSQDDDDDNDGLPDVDDPEPIGKPGPPFTISPLMLGGIGILVIGVVIAVVVKKRR